MNRPKPKPGDSVWIVPSNRHGNPHWGTVEKVGNKYFYIKELPNSRFSIDDWREISKYSAWYKLYPSQEEYDRSLRRQKIWSEIERYARNRYTVPDLLSDDDLQKIAEILGIEA